MSLPHHAILAYSKQGTLENGGQRRKHWLAASPRRSELEALGTALQVTHRNLALFLFTDSNVAIVAIATGQTRHT